MRMCAGILRALQPSVDLRICVWVFVNAHVRTVHAHGGGRSNLMSTSVCVCLCVQMHLCAVCMHTAADGPTFCRLVSGCMLCVCASVAMMKLDRDAGKHRWVCTQLSHLHLRLHTIRHLPTASTCLLVCWVLGVEAAV